MKERELKYKAILRRMQRYQDYIEKKLEAKPKIQRKVVNKRALQAGLDTFDDIFAGRITQPEGFDA